jgi:hypothetical protein
MIKTSMRARDHVASYVWPRSNALNFEDCDYSCSTIHDLPKIMSGPRKNNKVTNDNIRKPWSRHYTHKVAGSRLFDRCNKPGVIMPGFFHFRFFHFWLLLVTTLNFCRLGSRIDEFLERVVDCGTVPLVSSCETSIRHELLRFPYFWCCELCKIFISNKFFI